MIIAVLLAAVVVSMDCDITDVGNEMHDSNSGRQNALKTRRSKFAKDMAAKSRSHVPDFEKSTFRANSVQGFGKILSRNNTSPERRAKQSTDAVSGIRTKRQVLRDDLGLNMTWRGGVPYTFNTSDPTIRKVFELGAKVWNDNTCIDFVENKTAHDKLVLVKGNTCWSTNGRRGGEQPLCLSDHAPVGSAVHEIGHALGLLHTMQRYDRDGFIIILMENVNPAYSEDFTKISKDLAYVYGLTYDYGSVMHYDEFSGSLNGKTTINAVNSLYQKTMGSELISFSDIFMINEHYGCNARCNKSISAKCENEGYPHPRNCSVCICPSGYGGDLCDRRPPGCGDDLVATSEQKFLISSVGHGFGLRDQFVFCNYMITAPKDKKIEVVVQSISHGYDFPGCTVGGVEIKAQDDQKLTGYRFCTINGTGSPVISSSNHLPVILFGRLGTMEATLIYRHID